jgi:hypothetical protein
LGGEPPGRQCATSSRLTLDWKKPLSSKNGLRSAKVVYYSVRWSDSPASCKLSRTTELGDIPETNVRSYDGHGSLFSVSWFDSCTSGKEVLQVEGSVAFLKYTLHFLNTHAQGETGILSAKVVSFSVRWFESPASCNLSGTPELGDTPEPNNVRSYEGFGSLFSVGSFDSCTSWKDVLHRTVH